MQNTSERLDKFLANAGVASRRAVKQFLKKNVVTINGVRVTESGVRVDPKKDTININGQKIVEEKFVYYLLNKPIGIISTSSDEYGRTNVIDLIPTKKRIYPVGRLDKDTHGAILLTNDGELTHKLTHPRYHVPKKYLLKIQGHIDDKKIKQLREGVLLTDGLTAPANIRVIEKTPSYSKIEIELFEGRYRQIRRMCESVGITLVDLKRFQFGPILLGTLKEGDYRELTKKEITLLQKAVEK